MSFEDVETLAAMAESGDLPVRLWVMLTGSNESLAEKLPGYEEVPFLSPGEGDDTECAAIPTAVLYLDEGPLPTTGKQGLRVHVCARYGYRG